MSERLTETQIKALGDLAVDRRGGFRNASLGNRTAEVLCKRGLARWKSAEFFGGRYVITDAGRAALSREEGR